MVAFRTTGDQLARANRAIAMSRLLDERTLASSRRAAARIEGDERHFARERHRGRAFEARVTRVTYLRRRNQMPCEIVLEVNEQRLLRVRRGTHIRNIDGRLAGIVQNVAFDQETHRFILIVGVTMAAASATVGTVLRWADSQNVGFASTKGSYLPNCRGAPSRANFRRRFAPGRRKN